MGEIIHHIKRKSRSARAIILLILLVWITWRNCEYAWANQLIVEVKDGDYDAVEEILENNTVFSVNRAAGSPFLIRWFPECWPETPLNIACEKSDLRMVKMLLRYGADPNRAYLGSTPLYMTLLNYDHRDVEVIRCLIEHGADPDKAPLFGSLETALLWAANLYVSDKESSSDVLEIYQVLYEAADVKWPVGIWNNKTPLHYAVQRGNESLTHFLLEQPETVIDTMDIDRQTAYDIAVENRDTEMMQLLRLYMERD